MKEKSMKGIYRFKDSVLSFRNLGAPNLAPSDLAFIFEPYLFSWVDLVKIKASEQVEYFLCTLVQ